MRSSLVVVVWFMTMGCGKVVGDLPGPDGRVVDGGPLLPQNSIRRLRVLPPAVNTSITLRDVVIIGHATFRLVGEIYVQDRGISGPSSAIRIVCALGAGADCNLTARQIDELPIGRVVDVAGKYDQSNPPAPALPQPQVREAMVTDKGSTAAVAIETVPATLVAHTNAPTSTAPAPEVFSRLNGYVKVEGPIRITDTMPAIFMDTCDRTADAGAPETIYGGTLAEHTGSATVLALQLGATDYCRTQCLQTCAKEVTNGQMVQSIAGVLDVFPRAGAPELFIRPSRSEDVILVP